MGLFENRRLIKNQYPKPLRKGFNSCQNPGWSRKTSTKRKCKQGMAGFKEGKAIQFAKDFFTYSSPKPS